MTGNQLKVSRFQMMESSLRHNDRMQLCTLVSMQKNKLMQSRSCWLGTTLFQMLSFIIHSCLMTLTPKAWDYQQFVDHLCLSHFSVLCSLAWSWSLQPLHVFMLELISTSEEVWDKCENCVAWWWSGVLWHQFNVSEVRVRKVEIPWQIKATNCLVLCIFVSHLLIVAFKNTVYTQLSKPWFNLDSTFNTCPHSWQKGI